MTPSARPVRPAARPAPGLEAEEPALRSDAARNRAKILRAAADAFGEDGVDVGVESVAQRAGVGVGTLYRRFPTKESLIEAVVAELLRDVRDAAHDALLESPAVGFDVFLRAAGAVQAEHRGCLGRLWTSPTHDALRADIEGAMRTLLAQAREAGTVRADLVYEDAVVLLWSIRGVIESTAAVAPDAWRRHVDMLLAAVRPEAPAPDHPPLTAAELEAALAARSLHRSADVDRP
jgi:AcrR family transcriptional regulator